MIDKIKLDLIDKKIISELDMNARILESELSKKVSKSKQLVNYRIKRLEKEKVILGYHAIIDFSKLGFISFRVYIKLKSTTPKKQKEFLEFLKEQKEVWWLVSVENICDIAYATFVKDYRNFYDHLEKISKFNKIIKSKEIVIYSDIIQLPKSYILGERKNFEGITIGASEPEKIDEMDLKLLEILSKDAKTSLISIASKLKMTPQSAVYRLKKLEKKKIILGYRTDINLNLLGYKNYKIYLQLLNFSRLNELESFCKSNLFVVTTNRTIGGADFEIELQLDSLNDFYNLMDKIRENFSDGIESYEFGIAREEIKMIYFPSN